jgi:hypothetical protein
MSRGQAREGGETVVVAVVVLVEEDEVVVWVVVMILVMTLLLLVVVIAAAAAAAHQHAVDSERAGVQPDAGPRPGPPPVQHVPQERRPAPRQPGPDLVPPAGPLDPHLHRQDRRRCRRRGRQRRRRRYRCLLAACISSLRRRSVRAGRRRFPARCFRGGPGGGRRLGLVGVGLSAQEAPAADAAGLVGACDT